MHFSFCGNAAANQALNKGCRAVLKFWLSNNPIQGETSHQCTDLKVADARMRVCMVQRVFDAIVEIEAPLS